MKFVWLFFLMLTGCASDSFHEEVLADGKTWRVESPTYRCSIYKRDECVIKLNAAMSTHSQELCGGPDYRIFSCKNNDTQGFADRIVRANCLMQCRKEFGDTRP